MTTIVCNREYMAGDTLISSDVKANAPKLFKRKGHVLGVAGVYADCIQFANWWCSGADGEPPEMECVEAMVLTKEGRILCYNQHQTFFEVFNPYMAIGSGAMAGLAAMAMGATPEEAVRVAAAIDPNTGTEVTIHKRGKT